jgi:FKBP-type peptidyl-prolyl cis-trans isomerase
MKNKLLISLLISSVLLSCKVKGVKQNEQETAITTSKSQNTDIIEELKGVKDSAYRNEKLLIKTLEINQQKFDNGIVIKWYEKGEGALLEDEHVYKLDYEVLLEDGSVVDGSKIINRKWVHFLLGFELQTKGWDFALRKLKIGDFAEIVIPSELARGKEGIKGLIPPDAVNILRVKVVGEVQPDRVIDGTKVWTLAHSKKAEEEKVKEDSEIIYDYIVSTPSNPRYVNSHYNGNPYNFHFDDQGIVIGLKKALFGVTKYDRLWVVVPPEEAYGKKGLLDIVKPNEPVLYDLFIRDIKNVK